MTDIVGEKPTFPENRVVLAQETTFYIALNL